MIPITQLRKNIALRKGEIKRGTVSKFKDPEEILVGAEEYFAWCEKNPIKEEKVFCSNGEVVKATANTPRPLTQAGICIFLGVGIKTWHEYKKKDGFSDVILAVEDIMFEQKFAGAAAGQFNANIISRDLGLIDKTMQDITSGGEKIRSFSAEEYKAAEKSLLGEMKGLD